MNIFPLRPNGSVCQFPFQKSLGYRTIANTLEDGSRIVLEDPNAASINWKLGFSALTDTELSVLRSFFEAMKGRLQSFTFVDPGGNLLVWSEDLSQSAWQKSSFLQYQSGVADPLGTQRATSVTNAGSGAVTFTQSIPVPGSYLCCFSVYLQSAAPVTISISRGATAQEVLVGPAWQRAFLSGTTADGSDTSIFGLTLPPGGNVEVFGLQVQSQPGPSTYVPTLDRGAVYSATRFATDSLQFTPVAPNNSNCELELYSRLVL
jgi:hypothetical protein